MSKITLLKMPSLSPTMKTGNLIKWCKNVGDSVKLGDVIAEIETDKAIMEMESPGSGVLKRILLQAGSNDVVVETIIGVLAGVSIADSEIDALLSENTTTSSTAEIDMQRVGGYQKASTGVIGNANNANANINVSSVNVASVNSNSLNMNQNSCPASALENSLLQANMSAMHELGNKTENISDKMSNTVLHGLKLDRQLISPYARHLASTYGIADKLPEIQGSGENGCIVAADIESFMTKTKDMLSINNSNNAVSNGISVNGLSNNGLLVQMSNMRKAISRKVVHSKQTVPHFYVSADLNIVELEKAKQFLFDKYEIKTTINDWFLMACSRALQQNKNLNQVWEVENESLLQYDQVNINCAIDVGSGPLLVLLPNVESKGLLQIRDDMKKLVQLAKDKMIKAEHLATGTFSMSNLGMFNVSSFSAIINPPQIAVLAIGTSRNGICTVTVSCDHRVLDGRDAALFLQTLGKMIEFPLQMLL